MRTKTRTNMKTNMKPMMSMIKTTRAKMSRVKIRIHIHTHLYVLAHNKLRREAVKRRNLHATSTSLTTKPHATLFAITADFITGTVPSTFCHCGLSWQASF